MMQPSQRGRLIGRRSTSAALGPHTITNAPMILNVSSCPLYPQKRTSQKRERMSALGHIQTHASQQIASNSITSSGTSCADSFRATPLSEGPQSAALHLIAHAERS